MPPDGHLTVSGVRRRAEQAVGTVAAALHPDVDPATLFKHVSVDLPPVVRMRQILGWCTQRRLDQMKAAKAGGRSVGV